MNLAIIFLLIYLAILALITYLSSNQAKAEEFINSAKDLSATESTFTTFASLLTGYNFVIGVTLAFLYGFWYLMAFVGAALAFVILYFLNKKKLLPLQKDFNLLSIGDYFGLKYGKFSQISVNLILLGALLLFLILQLFINTELFSSLLGIDKIPALLLTTGVVALYLWFGGFKTSIKTDIFQGILMIPIILTVFVFPVHFSINKIPAALDPSLFWFAVGLAFLQFFSLLGQAESFQRVFASRDIKSLKRGLTVAFILIILVAGSIAYLGINFKFAEIATDPASLFTEGVLVALPKWLASLLTVSLIAAFMGTIDSSAFAFGAIAARFKNNEKLSVKSTRIFILAGILISAAGSLYLFSFLTSVFALISVFSVIGAALLVSYLINLKPIEINAFLLTGIVSFILGLLFKLITDNPLTALAPSVVAFVVLLLFLANRRIVKKRI
jgi:Na+/proline symporter